MMQKLEAWCYGGKSKAFYTAQSKAIHQYNTKMMERLLLVMTMIIGMYLLVSTGSGHFSRYSSAYVVCFIALFFMLCSFKLKAKKPICFTRIYMILFSVVMFGFVCALGTFFEPNARATLVIVYVLVLPMLFVIPTHYMYGFLSLATAVFSITALCVKDLTSAQMDITHSITCIVIGIFLSHHILESRMALYAQREQLDARNAALDKKLQEKEIQLLQSRISIMLSQIQPHFLYNTLTAICGLCDENPKEAKKVTAEFADYLRHNLESLTQSTPVPFEDELRHTKVYLGIEKKRFEQRLNIVYDIANIDFRIPALTIQPLVENAVKHGVTRKKSGGTVTLSTRKLEDCYEIIIADDGVGFDVNEPLTDPNTHVGIENVRCRLWSICRGTLNIKSTVGDGTTAIIKIPRGRVSPC
ncbi:MAG: histidine kinase [Anaerovoracaceae bacterium]